MARTKNAPPLEMSLILSCRKHLNLKRTIVTSLVLDCGASRQSRNDEGQNTSYACNQSLQLYRTPPNWVHGRFSGPNMLKVLPTIMDNALHLAVPGRVHIFFGSLSGRESTKDRKNYGGCTPILTASKRRACDAIEELIQHGADLEARDYKGHSRLHLNCMSRADT